MARKKVKAFDEGAGVRKLARDVYAAQPGTISAEATFQRSAVGAVSLIVAVEPAVVVGAWRFCTQ